MIMPRGAPLLLPVSPLFMASTVMAAMVLGMGVGMMAPHQTAWLPDLLAVTLVFWGVHQPRRVGVGTAFVLGLLTDVHQGSLLGQHGLSYALMAYGAVLMHRRVLWFDLREQALHILPLFVAAHATTWLVDAVSGRGWVSHAQVLAPLLEAAMWPAVSLLLLAPQRRAHDPDDTRPL